MRDDGDEPGPVPSPISRLRPFNDPAWSAPRLLYLPQGGGDKEEGRPRKKRPALPTWTSALPGPGPSVLPLPARWSVFNPNDVSKNHATSHGATHRPLYPRAQRRTREGPTSQSQGRPAVPTPRSSVPGWQPVA